MGMFAFHVPVVDRADDRADQLGDRRHPACCARRPPLRKRTPPDGKGYWLASANGGVFSFGDAGFHGSAAGLLLRGPVVAIVTEPYA
jgi:hypothetical protein